MKLSDIMSAAGLSTYAEIALVIFLLAFIAVVMSLFAPGRQRTYERMRNLPIDGETRPSELSVGTTRIPPARFVGHQRSE